MSLARSPVNIHWDGTTRALEEAVGVVGSQRQTQARLGFGFGTAAGKAEGTAVIPNIQTGAETQGKAWIFL